MPPKGGQETDLNVPSPKGGSYVQDARGPQNLGDRIVDGVRYIVTNILPSSWMSPGQPLSPVVAPEGVKGRIRDFQVGENLVYQPKSGSREGVGFPQLRNLADLHDVTRLNIETRKDQVAAMDWDVVMLDKGAKPDEKAIEACKKFLRFPDEQHDFATWTRMIVEDMLVVDAACIEPIKTFGGDLARLDPIDGTTIKPIIDTLGRRPAPPDVAYQQILKGIPASDYNADQIIYYPRNPRTWKAYGYSPVEQLVIMINIALQRETHVLEFYKDGTVPDAFLFMPEGLGVDEIKRLQDYFDALMTGNLAERRKVKMLPGGTGTQLVETKKVALFDAFDEWLARMSCYAFSLPATPFVAQVNRATAEQASDDAHLEGLVPLLNWLSTILNYALSRHSKWVNLKFVWKSEKNLDALKQAQADDLSVKNGTKQVDEIRAKNGDAPLGLPPGMITASGFVPFPVPGNEQAMADHAARQAASRPSFGDPNDDGEPGKPKPGKPDPNADKVAKKKRIVTFKFSPDDIPGEALSKLTKTIGDFFSSQAVKISKQVSRAYDSLDKASRVDKILNELDLKGWSFLVNPTRKTLADLAKKSAAKSLAQMKIENAEILNQGDENANLYAKERSAELVGMKWVNGKLVENPNADYAITDSTREMLRSTITTAEKEGWPTQRLAQEIKDNHAFSMDRAKLIANTEMADAHVAGNMAGWRASGVVTHKRSLLGSEHTVEDVCDDNAAAGWIGIDDTFPSGDDAPTFHPGCLVPDTNVSASGVSVYTRRRYEGEVVSIFVGGVNKVTITPNHPILTQRGWIAAGKLKKGDNLLEARNPSRTVKFIDPDNNQMEARIEDLVDSAFMSGRMSASAVPTSTKAFHGDKSINNEIDIVGVDRNLPPYFPNLRYLGIDKSFTLRHWAREKFESFGTFYNFRTWCFSSAHSFISGLRSAFSFLGCYLGIFKNFHFLEIPHLQSEAFERITQSRRMTANAFGNINAALAGHVSTVKVSDLKFSKFVGHVYNLETKVGWYFANGIIAHNCFCDLEAQVEPLPEEGAAEDATPESSAQVDDI